MRIKKDILNIFKPVGISPLDAIKALKEKYPELKDKKMTYAGRLDPLAEGVLLLLADDAVHQKENYLKLDKEYKAEILFGFKTDTYDILGLPKKSKHSVSIPRTVLGKELENFLGKNKMPYPPYSSYKIKGKPLFQWAREEKLGEIKIPERKTNIYEIKFLGFKNISGEKLLEKIEQKISLVKGDFRQKEIIKKWQEKIIRCLSSGRNNEGFFVLKIKIKCSSGTYIRSIAHKLGQNLKIGATLLSLVRTKVGEFDAKNSLRI